MKYKIVSLNDPDKMEEKINDLIKNGWQPQGGVSVGVKDGKPMLLQAMVN